MELFKEGERYSFTPKHDGVRRSFRILKVSNATKEPTVWFFENKLLLLNFEYRQQYTIDMWLEKWMVSREDCVLEE